MNARNAVLVGFSLLALTGLAACGPSSETKDTGGKTRSKTDAKDMLPAPKVDAAPTDKPARGDMKGMDHSAMKIDGKTGPHKATGNVRSLDANALVATLDHGPVASMNWPAMTMSFKVKDRTMLDKLAVGSKVEVEFVQQGGDYIITEVR